ncbi:MAG: restriction endonuclease subunit S [Moraxella sp.]|uniref:restriction endonuclease subunit S n=1 Tax=Moraxella sp. TaxID=479 RepID=UPI0026DC5CB5|nr:restriction endonuclease subunit S [Moraxella sp.]MDO4450131.1 restriction endonuclease subunit S [Moraxella sp.]
MHTFIKNLLNGQSVEWKTLGEVLVRTKGTKITAGQMKELHQENAPIKIFAGGKTFAMVNYGDIPEKDINQKPSIIVKSRGIIEFEYYDKPFSHKNEMWAYHSIDKNIDIKFVYYFLKLNEPFFQNLGSKMQMPQIATPDTDKFKIPIPPLPVQQKIVQILDAFTATTAELTAEYNLRVKQYQYYRDKLLNFSDNVEWKPLGEVAERIYSGGTPKTEKYEYWENGTIPWMSSGEVNLGTVFCTEKFITEAGLKNSSAKLVPKNSIVIALAGQGKTRGKVARIRIDLTTNQSLASLVFDQERINPDYVYHFLNTQYENLRRISSGEGTRGGLNLQMISNYKIPIPPLEIQTQIVEILDKFETLTHSISEGLPREIQLRQKQYEYYRALLLDFT